MMLLLTYTCSTRLNYPLWLCERMSSSSEPFRRNLSANLIDLATRNCHCLNQDTPHSVTNGGHPRTARGSVAACRPAVFHSPSLRSQQSACTKGAKMKRLPPRCCPPVALCRSDLRKTHKSNPQSGAANRVRCRYCRSGFSPTASCSLRPCPSVWSPRYRTPLVRPGSVQLPATWVSTATLPELGGPLSENVNTGRLSSAGRIGNKSRWAQTPVCVCTTEGTAVRRTVCFSRKH